MEQLSRCCLEETKLLFPLPSQERDGRQIIGRQLSRLMRAGPTLSTLTVQKWKRWPHQRAHQWYLSPTCQRHRASNRTLPSRRVLAQMDVTRV